MIFRIPFVSSASSFSKILRVSNLRPPRIRRPSVILASPRPKPSRISRNLRLLLMVHPSTLLTTFHTPEKPPNEEFQVTCYYYLSRATHFANPFRTKLEETCYNCTPIYCSKRRRILNFPPPLGTKSKTLSPRR